MVLPSRLLSGLRRPSRQNIAFMRALEQELKDEGVLVAAEGPARSS